MVTIKLTGLLRRLVERTQRIGSAIQDSMMERQRRTRPRRFLRSKRQAADEATSATPVIDDEVVLEEEAVVEEESAAEVEPAVDEEPAVEGAPVVEAEPVVRDQSYHDVDPIIGDRPPPYWPLLPQRYHNIGPPPPPYSPAPRAASPTSTVGSDDDISLAEADSINDQDGDNEMPEESGPAEVPTKGGRVD